MKKSIQALCVIGLLLLGSVFTGVATLDERTDNISTVILHQASEPEDRVDAKFTFAIQTIHQ